MKCDVTNAIDFRTFRLSIHKRDMDASASKMISSDISCDESFEIDAVLLVVVVVIMKIFLVVIWVSPSIQNNKLNQ